MTTEVGESDGEDPGQQESPADLIEVWEAVLPPQGKVLLNERDLQLHCHCTSMQQLAAHRHAVRRRCLSIYPTRCTVTLSQPSITLYASRHAYLAAAAYNSGRLSMILGLHITEGTQKRLSSTLLPATPMRAAMKNLAVWQQQARINSIAPGAPGIKNVDPAGTSTLTQP